MSRIVLRALGLVIVIPSLFVIYLFRNDLPGKEIPLALTLILSLLGFYLVWTLVRSINLLHRQLERVTRGEADTVVLRGATSQLKEMTEIINSLNSLTVDFRENTAQLERFIQQFAVLTELTEITAKVPDINELLSLVLQKAMGTAQAMRGQVLVRREDEEGLDVVASEGWEDETTGPPALLEVLANRVVESGQPLLLGGGEGGGDRDASLPEEADGFGSFLVMPLKTKAGTVGAVCLVERSRGGAFGVDDNQFLSVMLGQIGYAVENARLLQHARDAAQHLSVRVRHQELQIQDAQRQIMRSEKLSALGQLAGGVAHDFNNLLQAILGYTAFAQKGLAPDDKRFRDLEHVRRSAERAVSMTRELLAFGKRQVLRPADLDLSCVIADLVTMLRGVIGNTVQVEFDADPTPAAVHADQRQIEQVLMNLCLNARDAMPEGGRVRIQTRRVHLTEEFCALHPSALPGDHIRLTVEDDGIGMDESTLGQIFEPFFTTKEVGQGTGLGLATVYGIVQQHNGIIDVSSAVGRGTTFAIYLHAIDHAVAPAPKMEEIEPPTGTETLLLAEDFGDVRDLTVRVLEQAGYDVLVAANGQEAVRLFEGNEERIALALLDMVMPRMGGREAAHRIRQMKPGLPVLLTSGYSADVIDTRFLEEEGMGFITKPVSQAELLRGVRELIDASRTRQESEPGRKAA